MRETGDLFKQLETQREHFMKDEHNKRKGRNLTEAIKKRWQEYTELYKKKKVLMTQITMMWSLT